MKYTANVHNSDLVINTNNGTVSGKTFKAKEWIKENFEGIKWDSVNKAWTMDPEDMNAIIEMRKPYFVRVSGLAEVTETVKETTHHHANNGLCPICHTYCYGDCTAK